MTDGGGSKLYASVTRGPGLAVALILYAVAYAALRLWGSPNIGTDDVQQALAAQSWAWGYEPRNPPLYTWLLMGAYQVFGVTQLAHVVVKYTLLLGTFAFAYLAGKRMLKTAGYAALSALALILLMSIGVTMHKSFTHTVAVAFAQFATWWALLRVVQERKLLDYVLLGVAIAFGVLAKYNFLLFIGANLIAALSVREARAAVLNWRLLIALAVTAALIAPHAVWALEARYDFAARLRESAGIEGSGNYFTHVGAGLLDLLSTLVTELAPFWIVALVLFWPSLRVKTEAPARAEQRWLWRAMALYLVALLIFLFATGATEFKSRYLAPLILQAPLALFAWLDNRAPSERRLGLFGGAVGLMAVGAFCGLAAEVMFFNQHCGRCWREMPVPALADQLREEGFSDGTIIANEWHVGGNLRLQFPDAAILVPGFAETSTPRASGRCVLAWNARLDGEAPPEEMLTLARQRMGVAPQGTPAHVHALILGSSRADDLGYWIVSNANGDCRAANAPP